VATGLEEMHQILQRFDVLVGKIESNVHNFQQAGSIPTKGTPTTLLQAQFAVPAGALILAGVLGLGVPAAAGTSQRRRTTAPRAPASQPVSPHT
jgi:hypothetical protein